jgi:hypothetical protein
LSRLGLHWGRLFGLGNFHQDPSFDFSNEAQKACVVLKLALWVNQLLAVSELDPFARITEPTYPHDPLQGLSSARKLLSDH